MATTFLIQPQLGPDAVTYAVLYGISVPDSGNLSGIADYNESTGLYTFTAPSLVIAIQPLDTLSVLEMLNFSDDPGHQEISPMNTVGRNQVIIDDGGTLDLQVFNTNYPGVDPSALYGFWYNYNYMAVQWTEGSADGGIYTNSFIGVRGRLEKPNEGKGKQTTTGHLLEVNPGTPQFSRVQTA